MEIRLLPLIYTKHPLNSLLIYPRHVFHLQDRFAHNPGIPIASLPTNTQTDITEVFPATVILDLYELTQESLRGWTIHSARICGDWEYDEVSYEVAYIWLVKKEGDVDEVLSNANHDGDGARQGQEGTGHGGSDLGRDVSRNDEVYSENGQENDISGLKLADFLPTTFTTSRDTTAPTTDPFHPRPSNNLFSGFGNPSALFSQFPRFGSPPHNLFVRTTSRPANNLFGSPLQHRFRRARHPSNHNHLGHPPSPLSNQHESTSAPFQAATTNSSSLLGPNSNIRGTENLATSEADSVDPEKIFYTTQGGHCYRGYREKPWSDYHGPPDELPSPRPWEYMGWVE
ncbi:hypothetical protein HYFRA_00006685 [Hymenoscyphus fraxineus]|uniref:Uncharacterized protein n=1 Tax=Hymenoscyphus fraxineus TaxID=746836 RepID=A0A9N9KVT7_9HELO|nr:hypothetical protein HYFRA_00006685 [Hymenoscyphus fraxineus]